MQSLFTQNVIAVIWDFDKTLTPSYMQAPLFKHFGVDEKTFWNEANGLEKFYRAGGAHNVSKDTLYLNPMLTYVREGKFAGLTNDLLFKLGSKIEFYKGLPEFFARLKNEVGANRQFAKHGISVEHYIVSTGLRKMIEGSEIAPFVDGIWGCEFVEGTARPGYLDKGQQQLFQSPGHITDIAYAIDNTTKTRALFEISKGSNKEKDIDVNATLAPEDRRVPFQNMIYIADGPSDVPAFSIVNQYGGRTIAVYKPALMDQFSQAAKLQEERRVQAVCEASYIAGSQADLTLSFAVNRIATKIVEAREAVLKARVGVTPRHILTDIPEAAVPAATVPVDAIPVEQVPAVASPSDAAPADAASAASEPALSKTPLLAKKPPTSDIGANETPSAVSDAGA